MSKFKKYTCEPRGHQWAVVKWEELPNGRCGTTVSYHQTKEAARELVKERNILTLRACKKVERDVDAFLSLGATGPSSRKQENGPLQPSLF